GSPRRHSCRQPAHWNYSQNDPPRSHTHAIVLRADRPLRSFRRRYFLSATRKTRISDRINQADGRRSARKRLTDLVSYIYMDEAACSLPGKGTPVLITAAAGLGYTTAELVVGLTFGLIGHATAWNFGE